MSAYTARAAARGGAHAVSMINTINSLMGVDLDSWNPIPHVDGKASHGGFCGPAVKPIALNMVADCARDPQGHGSDLRHRRHRDLARRGRVHAHGRAATYRFVRRSCTTASASSTT